MSDFQRDFDELSELNRSLFESQGLDVSCWLGSEACLRFLRDLEAGGKVEIKSLKLKPKKGLGRGGSRRVPSLTPSLMFISGLMFGLGEFLIIFGFFHHLYVDWSYVQFGVAHLAVSFLFMFLNRYANRKFKEWGVAVG